MTKVDMKTVDIKGKEYVTVNERVKAFHQMYPNGRIQTSLQSESQANRVVFLCKVYPDVKNADRFFTGWASESIGDGFINKTSAMENAETSAVGRALGFLNIGIVDSIASVDEVNKANVASKNPGLNKPTTEQRRMVQQLMGELGIHYSADNTEEWTKFCMEAIGVPNPNNQEQSDQLIEYMQNKVIDRMPAN